MADPNGDGKLLINLKNPKGNDDTRICQVCNKVFGCGKALGGHMRIHYQAQKHSIKPKECNKFKPVKQKAPTCVLCGKNFMSHKSLFGHMRSHPERDWRGIEPPSSIANNSFSSELENDDYSSGSDEDSGEDDLTESLPKWSVTAKRSSNVVFPDSTSSDVLSSEDKEDEGEEIYEVAELLMLLKTRHPITFEVTNSNSLVDKVEPKDSNPVKGLKRQKIDESPYVFSGDQTLVQEQLSINGSDEGRSMDEIADDQPLKINKSKKRKRMKLMDLENDQDHASAREYKCSTCNKCLPTYQALGGHRSSHNKFKLVIQNANDSSSSEHQVKVEKKKESEETVVVGEGSTHQCDICFKFFASGRALGGHKRSHWSVSTEAQSSQVISPGDGSFTGGKVLDFDLNELASADSYLIN